MISKENKQVKLYSQLLGILCDLPLDNSSSRVTTIDLDGNWLKRVLNTSYWKFNRVNNTQSHLIRKPFSSVVFHKKSMNLRNLNILIFP
jgi:hypothetical protein